MARTLSVGSRSLFVNLTAWAAIVVAALVSGVAGLQHAPLAALPPQRHSATPAPWAGWLLHYLPGAIDAAALLSLLLVVAAVGLLLRLNWARRVFIALAALAIAANALGLWLQHALMRSLVSTTLSLDGLPPTAVDRFGGLATTAQVLGLLVTLAGCALLAWVIRKLMSEPVRQEFA